eukprot:4262105-Pleurochrysis_carterae.AAC.1
MELDKKTGAYPLVFPEDLKLVCFQLRGQAVADVHKRCVHVRGVECFKRDAHLPVPQHGDKLV